MVDTLPLKIALRFLRSSKAQTVLIILGLAIGIAVQVFVGSLLQNLQDGFLESTTGDASHVTVLPDEDGVYISDWEMVVLALDDVKGVRAVSPVADSPALLNHEGASNSVLVRGMDMTRAEGIYEWSERTIDGAVPTGDGEVMVGKELSEGLGLGVGESVQLITPTQATRNLTVSGIYDLGAAGINERWVIVTIDSAQSTFAMGDNVTSIESQVSSVFVSDTIGDRAADALAAYPVTVENWKDSNPDFFSALNAQGSSSYMIQTFVLMSVIIGIASVLSITVVQKSRQIGILKAMGIKDSQSSLIFMFQGLLLGAGGAVLGVLLGSLLFYGFVQAISSSGDSIIATTFNIPFIVGSGLVAMLSAVGASLLPALKSRRLDPIEVIRNG